MNRRSTQHGYHEHDPLAVLLEETVALYHQLTADAERIHHRGALSGPRRTVLIALQRSGPQTVAQMARARAQSRQRLQPLVNRLLDDGLVEARPNPNHAKSPLIALTRRGERAVADIVQREASLRARFRLDITPAAIRRAATVLRTVRLGLASQLPHILATADRRGRR
jgi:DNA-binding MarR family transcriptional regulator